MRQNKLSVAVSIIALLAASNEASANFTVTVGSGTTIFAIDAANQGTSLCAASVTECEAHVAINTAGAPIGVSGTPFFVTGSGGTFPATLNASPSLANGNGVVPTQGGSVLSATNGSYSNLLQGNAALSATNGLYANLLQGNAVLATGNPLFAQLTAGSAIAGKVGIDQTTVGTTNGVSLSQIGANTVSTGAGAVGTGSARFAVGQDTTTIAGSAPGTAGTPSANVLSIQGVTSMTPLLVNPGTAANWGVAADNAAWTAGTTLQVPLGCEYTSGGATALTTGHVGTPGCTSARAQFTDKSSVSGTALGAAVSNLGTLASGTPAVENVNAYIVGGAGSGGTAVADNAAWTAGTTSQTPIGCEYTSGGATALTTGHVGTPGCTSARALFTDKTSIGGTALATATEAYGTAFASQTATVERVDAFVTNSLTALTLADAISTTTYGSASPTLGGELLWNGTTYDRWREGGVTGSGMMAGAAAAGTAIASAGNPLVHAVVAETSDQTAITAGDTVVPEATPNGKTIVQPWALSGNFQSATTTGQTGTGTVNVLAASGTAGIKEYMTSIQMGRSDAGTTAITAAITDGTSTYTFAVPNNGGGGGNNISFVTPIAFVANHAVTCAASAGVTTFYCTAQGYNAP